VKALYDNRNIVEVQVDALVILKIIKHCREALPEIVTGQLLGLDLTTTLEVTNCFPFPSKSNEEEDPSDETTRYQMEMLRCLREVNVDNNTVGWYQSTYVGSGSHLNEAMIEYQFNYQSSIKKSVVLVYDPLKSSHGSLSLKAYRLSDQFLVLYKQQNFTKESLSKSNFQFNHIFEEIPIRIYYSALVKALLFQLELKHFPPTYEALGLATNTYFEKNLEFLIDCISDLQQEQNKFHNYNRSAQRVQQAINAVVAKRKAENAQRKLNGEPPLPEGLKELEMENPSVFKKPQEPSRLESLVITNQIHNYCTQISQYGAQCFTKLYLSNALKDKDAQ